MEPVDGWGSYMITIASPLSGDSTLPVNVKDCGEFARKSDPGVKKSPLTITIRELWIYARDVINVVVTPSSWDDRFSCANAMRLALLSHEDFDFLFF
jgi:hypothetical protein